jgi:uncharacterized OB-fold protein
VSEPPFDDPTTAPFWEAALDGRLVVQRCNACGASQLYPRPFCLACDATDLGWADAAGIGTVYSITVNRLAVQPNLEPPYEVALVDLDEGPRVMTGTHGDGLAIDDRVRLEWRAGPDGHPALVATRL